MTGRLVMVRVLVGLLLEVEMRLLIDRMLVGARESAVKVPWNGK